MSYRVVVVVVAAETIVVAEVVEVEEVVEVVVEMGKCKGVHTRIHSASSESSLLSATIKLKRSVWTITNVDYLPTNSPRFPELHPVIYCAFTMWMRTVYSFHCNRKEALSSPRNVTMTSAGNSQYRSNLFDFQKQPGSVKENSCQMNLGA